MSDANFSKDKVGAMLTDNARSMGESAMKAVTGVFAAKS
jgi:hypothetical protein